MKTMKHLKNESDYQVNPPLKKWEQKILGVPLKKTYTLVTGLLLLSILAVVSILLSKYIGESLLGYTKSPISAVMVVMVIGMIIGNIFSLPDCVKPGLHFGMKKLLRLGIILLGIRLCLTDVFTLGAISIPIIILCISTAILITSFLIKKLNQPKRLGTLIAVGTSICGVSAIVVTSPVIDANEEETAYAVAIITIFGLIATVVYPIIAFYIFNGDAIKAGLWLGTSIHDTSQVTGAGMVYAELWDAALGLDVASVTKLVRNIFMVFVIPLLSYYYRKKTQDTGNVVGIKPKLSNLFPMFVIGFLALTIIRTIGDFGIENRDLAYGFIKDEEWVHLISIVKQWAGYFFVVALGGVGLTTKFKNFRGLGWKPFIIGLFAALGTGLVSYILISTLGNLIVI